MAELFFLEGIAGAPKAQEGVGMIGTASPIAFRADELLFGHEKLAIPAFEPLAVLDLEIASFTETCELCLHRGSFCGE
jgi:hypothetical protein